MSEAPEGGKKDEYIEQGVRALEAGKYADAAAAFIKASEEDPSDPQIYRNLGFAYELLRDFEKARGAYAKALEAAPSSASAMNNLAGAAKKLGNRHEAAILFESAIATDPLFIEPYMNIARMFMEINAFALAEPYIRKILEIEPGNAEALNLLGVITNITSRHEEAVGHFQEALRRDSNQAVFFSNLGTAFRNTGDMRRAIMAFEKAAELSPNTLSTLNNLGVLYRETGDTNKAEQFLSRAAEFYPENPFPFFNLAELAIERENYAVALDYLKRYIELVPLDLDALYKTCGIARLADRLGDVTTELKSFLDETGPDDPRRDIVAQWLSMTSG